MILTPGDPGSGINKDFLSSYYTQAQGIKETMLIMNEEIGNLSRKIGTIIKNQMKILEVKHTITVIRFLPCLGYWK